MKQNRRYLKYELHQSTRTKSNVDQKSIDAGTGRHMDCIDFLFYGSAFEI